MPVLSASLAAAAATGVVGSLHCAVMCGPLAVAGGTVGGRVVPRRVLAYAAGRLASYAAVGAIMGLIGEHALCVLPVGTVQVAATVFVVAFFAWRALRLALPRAAGLVTLGPRKPSRLLAVTGKLFERLPRGGLGLGLATGILPCGMLLPAWALAAATGSAAGGAFVMFVFGAASLPGLLAPVLGGHLVPRLLQRVSPSIQALAWGVLALWIAVRPVLMAGHHH